MQTTLILPDIHHDIIKANKIIDHEAPDDIIFLGDYFDDWHDTPEISIKTAIWLSNSLREENRVHLFGNHEGNFRWFSRIYECKGYARDKFDAINSILNESDWNKLAPYVIRGNVLFSHAGLNKVYCRNIPDLKDLARFLDLNIRQAYNDLILNQPHWIFSAGISRGGYFDTGGINWCDFNKEFKPANVPYAQIFGHTPSEGPKVVYFRHNPRFIKDDEQFDLSKGGNFCLDTRARNWYGLIQDNVLIVKKWKPEEN